MATDTQVRVTLDADAKPYEKAMASAAKSTKATDEAVKGVNKSTAASKLAWAAAGAAVTAFGAKAAGSLKECIDAAGDLNESTSKMKVIFGTASKDIVKFAEDSASKLGMSKQAAYDAASTFATFGKAAGLAGQDLSKFSTDMVGLSADLASFYNTSPEDAIDAIGAALRGESEPIRRYGVLLDDATLKNRAMEMGIISSTKNALTPQQRALAAQAAILAQTSDAQGDFMRTSDGLANSQRSMEGAIANAKAELGESLLPVMAKGVSVVADLAEAFGKLPGPVKDTLAGVAGLTAVIALVGPGVATVAGGIGKATSAIKAYRVAQVEATVTTDAMTAASGRLAGASGLGGVAAAVKAVAVPLGILVAAGAGLTLWAKHIADGKTAAAVQTLSGNLATAATTGKSLGDAMSWTLNTSRTTGIDKNVQGIAEMTAALGRGKGIADQVRPAFAALDQQLMAMSADDAKAAFLDLASQVEAAGGNVDTLKAALPTYAAQVKATAQANMEAAKSEEAFALKAEEVADAINKAKTALFAYIAAKLAAAGSADAMLGAEDRLAQVIAANAKAHNGVKGAVEGHSKAALANREALRQEASAIASNAQAVYDLAIQQGSTAPAALDKSRAAILKGRDALIEYAQKAGLSKNEAAKYIAKLLEIPAKTKTELMADARDLLTKLADAKAKLKDPNLTDPERTKLKAEIADLEAKVEKAKKKLGTLPGSVTTDINADTSDSDPALKDTYSFLRKIDGFVAEFKIKGQAGGLGGGETGAGGGSSAAIARALGTTSNKVGYCGQTVQGWLGGHGLHGPTAIAAWDGAPASMKHTGTPPAGVAVYFRGGKSGHVALSLGNGMIRSTDWPSAGVTGTTSIQTLQLAWGKKYVGWASQYATGGKVNGPGTATSDSIPARLSDGEWVINAKASKHYGDGLLSAINERRFATGGKAKAKAVAKRNSAASNLMDDIQWRSDMGMLDQAGVLAALKSIKGATGQTAKDLALQIHRIEADMAQSAQDAAEKAAQTQQDAAEEAARIQQQAADEAAAKLKAAEDKRDQYASSVAQGLINSLGLGQTAANGKRWGVGSMLGDFAKRAGQATEFSRMVQELTSRGLAQDVVQQVVAAGPVAGVDMARALMAMSADQLATVNANQNAIRGAGAGMGAMLANAFYGVAGSQQMTIELTGGAPVVLQLDSRSIYNGQLELQRQMGGAYAFVSR